jgi:alkylation response protein AidB-like acyl-CoA dehydrogenase
MTTPSESTEHIEALVALETFRLYVRDWMSANAVIPDEIRAPVKGQPLSPEMKQWVVEFRRKLGAQGWIAPNWPRRYGGGGLPGAYASVVQRELAKQSIPPIYVSIMHAAALRTFGTEEQKTTLLKSLLQGEITMCHAFNERTHGSDISANTTEAVRDGDDYIITGTKDYITSILPPDVVLTLAVTNPDAPRNQRMSMVAVDTDTDGVVIKPENLLLGGREHKFLYTEASVSREKLVGLEGQGIEIAEFMVDIERGSMASVPLDRQQEVERREAEFDAAESAQ